MEKPIDYRQFRFQLIPLTGRGFWEMNVRYTQEGTEYGFNTILAHDHFTNIPGNDLLMRLGPDMAETMSWFIQNGITYQDYLDGPPYTKHGTPRETTGNSAV